MANNNQTEIWLPIHVSQVTELYSVSSNGRIKSLARKKHTPYGSEYQSKEKELKQTCTYNGYLSVTLSNKPFNKSFYVHILVATLYVANPNNYEFVNHKDGNKKNNHFENLEWCTRSDNMIHAFSSGLIPTTRKRKSLLETKDVLPKLTCL